MEFQLDELISAVEDSADSSIERVSAAAVVKDQLAGVGDDLLDHFVKLAREDGCSWTDIGDALGVTRQAAQQRHGSLFVRLLGGLTKGAFQRFTPRARKAVTDAQVAARERRHREIGTEHVLLGLLEDEGSIAVMALRQLEVDPTTLRQLVDERLPAGDTPVKGHIPFAKPAKKTLELSLREALALGHNYIGTEHILLALARVDDGAGRLLADQGADTARLRPVVVALLANHGKRPSP
jgi:Clp amino terminal domain, pathogenicity island component